MSSFGSYGRRVFICAALAGVGACKRKTTLKVGWKAGTEQNLLAEIAAQAAEKRLGLAAERISLGGTTEAHQSLLTSVIDLYPEHPGAAISVVLKQEPPTDSGALLEVCRTQYQPMQLDWLDPFGYESRWSLIVHKATAEAEKLTRASDLLYLDRAWTLGITRDFQRRSDGYEALQRGYALRLKDAPRVEDSAVPLFNALRGKAIDVITASSSNGYLLDPVFVALEDDRIVFGRNRPALVVRQDLEGRFPGIGKALRAVSGKLNDKTIRELNRAIDHDKKPVAEVAAGFLRQIGV